MNTPAHLLIGAAAFGHDRKTTWLALAGALLPDLSLYLLAGASLFVLQIPPETVFDELYFSDAWQQIFAIDNSFFLWGAGLIAALWLNARGGIAFFGSGSIHVVSDFLLHNDDARRHFWPLSDWVFHSPFSYWDRDHHAGIISNLSAVICVILTVILWRRLRHPGWRVLFALLLAMELSTHSMWRAIF